VRQIIARTIDFGATDNPLPANQLAEHSLVQFPMILGGVVPVVNIRSVLQGALRMDANEGGDL